MFSIQLLQISFRITLAWFIIFAVQMFKHFRVAVENICVHVYFELLHLLDKEMIWIQLAVYYLHTRIVYTSNRAILTTRPKILSPNFSEHTHWRTYSKTFINSVFWVLLSGTYTHSTGYENEYRFKILRTHFLKNLVCVCIFFSCSWLWIIYILIFKKNCLDHLFSLL